MTKISNDYTTLLVELEQSLLNNEESDDETGDEDNAVAADTGLKWNNPIENIKNTFKRTC